MQNWSTLLEMGLNGRPANLKKKYIDCKKKTDSENHQEFICCLGRECELGEVGGAVEKAVMYEE